MSDSVLRAATRASALALRQTAIVADLLRDACGITVEPVTVSTAGDRQTDTAIQEMGGKGVFVTDVQAAVLDGRADMAVHSAKDLQSQTPQGLMLAAVPRRGDPRDALIGCRLDDLPRGATVATGAPRRRAQLARLRPDVALAELRGNISTRLAKAEAFDAVIMAVVALHRLQLTPAVVDVLDAEVFVPQVAQGAIAVECRSDDPELLDALRAVEHPASRRNVDAERAFLAALGGDCNLPAGAHAVAGPTGAITLTAMLASHDGQTLLRTSRQGTEPEALGHSVAQKLLDDHGGLSLLQQSADADAQRSPSQSGHDS